MKKHERHTSGHTRPTCTRGLRSVVLLLAASAAAAGLPAAASESPSPTKAHSGLARVVARPGQAVRFAQLLESQCEGASACSDRDLSVAGGDRLVTGGTEERRVYVW